MKVLGIDPSLRNWGMTVADLDVNTLAYEVETLVLCETAADKANKKTVRKNSDDLRRCREIHKVMHDTIKAHDAKMAFIEVPVGSQSARAMMSYGACIGLLASLEIPCFQLTPNEVKLAAVQDKNASKREMIAWAYKKFPSANWYKGKGPHGLGEKNEHLADATAAIEAGIQTNEFAALIISLKSLSQAA